jgi:hypothetical protein
MRQFQSMVKRIVAAPLWIVSIWLIYGLVAYFTGLPAGIGGVLGGLAAAFVLVDPTGVFWGVTPRRDESRPGREGADLFGPGRAL